MEGFYWNLGRTFLAISCIFSFLGIFCNTLIFLTTIKTRSLRATYNILIAVCAVSDVFHQFGTLVQLPLVFGVYIEIDSDVCNMIMFLPEMGIGIGCTCIVCIGLDRMISVLFSLRYRSLNKRYYYSFLASLITAYCVYLCSIMFIFHRKRRVFCEIMAPYPDIGGSWFAIANLSVNIVSSFVYFIIWMGLRSQADSRAMRRIIKSLFIIVAVDVSGWLLTPGFIELSQHLNFEPQHKFAWVYFSIIFINLALAIKLPIYYSTSSEYRAALRSVILGKSADAKGSMTVERTRTITI